MPPRASARATTKAAPKEEAKPKAKTTKTAATKKATGAKPAAKSAKAADDKPKAKSTKAATTKATKAAPSKAKPAATKAKATEAAKKTTKTAAKPEVAKAKPKTTKSATPASEAEEDDTAVSKPKAVAGKKRARSTEAAEPTKKEPVPVKRRRTAALVNELATAPAGAGLSLFVWGTGDMGQFGEGPDDMDEKPRPQLHKWFKEKQDDGELGSSPGGIERIAAGGMHNLAIDENGLVRSWGINDNAALGRPTADVPDPAKPGETIPTDELETYPLVVEKLKDDGFRAVKIAAGDSISAAVSDKGQLRAWGSFRSNEGILGFDAKTKFQFVPVEPPALRAVEVADVAAGADHVLALTTDGFVYTWGNQQQGQLGWRATDRNPEKVFEPQRLGLRGIVHVAAGQYHSFAVDKAGKVWAWGLNTFHQLGLPGSDEIVWRPQIVSELSPENHNGARVIQVEGGEHHSLFLFDNGEVWGVGRCDAKELGLGPDHPAQEGLAARRADVQAEREKKVKHLETAVATAEAAEKPNTSHIAKLKEQLSGAQHALHVPMGEYVPEPVKIAFPRIPVGEDDYKSPPELGPWSDAPTENPIASISAGTRHNLAVSRAGYTYAWGLGNQAQLGLGNAETADTPTWVRSKQLKEYASVAPSAGGQHCLLLARKNE